jgi:hypothetical protein
MSTIDSAKIKVISISVEIPPDYTGMPDDCAKVVFQIEKHGPTYPVYVQRHVVSDDNIVRVARHYLHMQAQRIMEATASWRLSDDDYKKIAVAPQNIFPNTGPAIPQ